MPDNELEALAKRLHEARTKTAALLAEHARLAGLVSESKAQVEEIEESIAAAEDRLAESRRRLLHKDG